MYIYNIHIYIYHIFIYIHIHIYIYMYIYIMFKYIGAYFNGKTLRSTHHRTWRSGTWQGCGPAPAPWPNDGGRLICLGKFHHNLTTFLWKKPAFLMGKLGKTHHNQMMMIIIFILSWVNFLSTEPCSPEA